MAKITLLHLVKVVYDIEDTPVPTAKVWLGQQMFAAINRECQNGALTNHDFIAVEDFSVNTQRIY